MYRRADPVVPLLLTLFPLLLGACSEAVDPQSADPAGLTGTGEFDPGDGTFLMSVLSVSPDGLTFVPLELIGGNLATYPDSQRVTLDVSVRNAGDRPLYGPFLVYLSRFDPTGVLPLNADRVIVPMKTAGPIAEVEYGYDYTELLDENGALAPGATSGAKVWEFEDPDLASFSFASRAEVGPGPDSPRIAGRCFWDADGDGRPDEGEDPAYGHLTLIGPDGAARAAVADRSGFFAFPVATTGLYVLHFDPMFDGPSAPEITTPNPRRIVLTPDANGAPLSFEEAYCGLFAPADSCPGIRFTDAPADSLHFAEWSLIDAEVADGTALRLSVGFSGCGPDQPFSLYASGGFMESEPVRIRIVPVKEQLDECDAAWQSERCFDLKPLYRRYLESHGPGILILEIVDFHGESHRLEFPVFPED